MIVLKVILVYAIVVWILSFFFTLFLSRGDKKIWTKDRVMGVITSPAIVLVMIYHIIRGK